MVPEDTLQRLRNQMAECQAERENEGREPAPALSKWGLFKRLLNPWERRYPDFRT